MSTLPMSQAPVVPPRPVRSLDRDAASGLMPKVPPRPGNKYLDRSVSPSSDRFAQSPLMQGIPPEPMDNGVKSHQSERQHSGDPIERSRSVDLPSVGEEGMEYGAVTTEINQEEPEPETGPLVEEQTRLVGQGLKLHAPKPSLPASSAKQQVMAVTRTDSEKAAAFGIGKPSSGEERAVSQASTRKRPGSSYSGYSDQGNHTDEDHGIPEIGQRVPMNKHLGDVQAPSPGPGHEIPKKDHNRKHGARSLPPGSYGLHGHGIAPQDKLEKAYYEKHPEARQREKHTSHHDRQNDFAMSSSDLNRLVRDTASRQALNGISDVCGTPTDDVAFEATEKYTSRISSSRPSSSEKPNVDELGAPESRISEDDKGIHVDDGKNPEFSNYGEDQSNEEIEDYSAPILASDEVSKNPSTQSHKPAIRPHLQRGSSSYDGEDPSSRPSSRAKTQRHHSNTQELKSTSLEDVEEYDPLFPEDGKDAKVIIQAPEEEHCERNHFPSKDVWEDAPNSVHVTAEVSTPDVPEPERRRPSSYYADRPITPAHAFALYQEELAEKETKGRPNNFLPPQDSKSSWAGQQSHLEATSRPASGGSKRFPSRDVWEDAPESHIHETEISSSPVEQTKPEIPARPSKKPSPSPEQMVARQNSGDDAAGQQPSVSDKPKPSVPPRPAKSSSGDSKDAASKPKPPVPNKSVGGKIAALQAGFMSDLNKRLQLGPQGVKREEPREEESVEEQEKAPLADARKSRARGPQRRAPAKSPAPAPSQAVAVAPVLSFSTPHTVWMIHPEHGELTFSDHENETSRDNIKSDEPPEPSAAAVGASATSEQDQVIEPEQTAPEVILASLPAAPKASDEPPRAGSEPDKNVAKDSRPREEEVELSLAANMAGESILEATVQKKNDGLVPVEVHDDVKN